MGLHGPRYRLLREQEVRGSNPRVPTTLGRLARGEAALPAAIVESVQPNGAPVLHARFFGPAFRSVSTRCSISSSELFHFLHSSGTTWKLASRSRLPFLLHFMDGEGQKFRVPLICSRCSSVDSPKVPPYSSFIDMRSSMKKVAPSTTSAKTSSNGVADLIP